MRKTIHNPSPRKAHPHSACLKYNSNDGQPKQKVAECETSPSPSLLATFCFMLEACLFSSRMPRIISRHAHFACDSFIISTLERLNSISEAAQRWSCHLSCPKLFTINDKLPSLSLVSSAHELKKHILQTITTPPAAVANDAATLPPNQAHLNQKKSDWQKR